MEKFERFINSQIIEMATNIDAWIGLNNASGSWKWADGKPASYLNWDNGQPMPGGDCAYISASTGKWSSANCDIRRSFLCEIYL